MMIIKPMLVSDIEEHNKDRWKDTHTLIPFMITNHNKEDASDWVSGFSFDLEALKTRRAVRLTIKICT